MPINLTADLPNIMQRRQLTKKELKAMKNDERWEDSEEAREMCRGGLMSQAEFEDLFPQDFGKALHPDGNWVQVMTPPHCEITVPPFSIWFAKDWPTTLGCVAGVHAKRVQIVTPKGTLGLRPHEYSIVKDVSEYIGREKEGIILRQMNDKPVCNTDHLFYLMSRGISRQRACLMLIHDIKDPTFLWLEFAPQYGEYFGREWPSPKYCPFAAPRAWWVADNEPELAKQINPRLT